MPSLEWSDIDWGTAPAWVAGLFGGLSLLVALSIFLRDHINAERAQVDRIGPWVKVSYPRRAPDEPGPLPARATAVFTVRNASDLPVRIVQLRFVWRTRWAVPDLDQPAMKSGQMDIWKLEPGTDAMWASFEGFDIAPQEVWTSEPKQQDLSHQAPEGAAQLWLIDGVTCDIAWLLIRDNAGRRWEARPGVARRARRIRWYSRPREGQSLDWFSLYVLMRRFWFFRLMHRFTTKQADPS